MKKSGSSAFHLVLIISRRAWIDQYMDRFHPDSRRQWLHRRREKANQAFRDRTFCGSIENRDRSIKFIDFMSKCIFLLFFLDIGDLKSAKTRQQPIVFVVLLT
jgi:hypothetical protein